MTKIANSFSPQWTSPPGDTIKDIIEERNWTVAQLSEALGYSPQFVNQLLNGQAAIAKETALNLARVLGSTPEFWLNREAQYRLQIVNQEHLDNVNTRFAS
ncbi:MAG: HigA family addiction module antitoxin [Microcystaceae cyanobacterium]